MDVSRRAGSIRVSITCPGRRMTGRAPPSAAQPSSISALMVSPLSVTQSRLANSCGGIDLTVSARK